MLNHETFQKIQQSGKQVLVVTKYWDRETTLEIYNDAEQKYSEHIFGLGENRVETLREKNLPRQVTHFIGNIQSQKIPEIVRYCSTIHSLSSLKHAQKIENQSIPIKAFVQIKLDEDKNIGITESQIPEFLYQCAEYKYLTIIGFSGMGSGEFSSESKKKEFQKLIYLRDLYLPDGLISAGTSRDYEIALGVGIDIVRVGSSILPPPHREI